MATARARWSTCSCRPQAAGRRCWCSSMAATGSGSIRKAFTFVAEQPLAAGAAVALIGYDLAPAVDMDAIVGQIRRGLAWLLPAGRRAGLRSRAHVRRRPLGRRPPRGDGAGDRLGGGRPAARPDQGRLRDQRRVRPRADPAVLPERGAGPGPRAGATQQPAASAAGPGALPGRRSRWARPRPRPSTRRAAPMPTSSPPRAGPASWSTQPGMHHFEIVMSLARPEDALVRILCEQMGLAPPPA